MSQISRERERIFGVIREDWQAQIFLSDWVLQNGIGEPLTSAKIQLEFLETFELSYLWLYLYFYL